MTFPRRMIESAAHLVDHVFPEASTRQFVLTFPTPLRFLLAAQPEALTQVLAVVQRGISTFVVQHSGLTVSSGARTGAVTLIQRFGSALNPHLHMLFLDGAYSFSGQRPTFHRARRLPPDELLKLLDSLSRRIVRLLERRGLLIADSEHPALDLEVGSPLDQIQAASLHYRIAFGPHAGRKARADRHAGKASCAQARKPPCRLSRHALIGTPARLLARKRANRHAGLAGAGPLQRATAGCGAQQSAAGAARGFFTACRHRL
jgi:hypothetical protein